MKTKGVVGFISFRDGALSREGVPDKVDVENIFPTLTGKFPSKDAEITGRGKVGNPLEKAIQEVMRDELFTLDVYVVGIKSDETPIILSSLGPTPSLLIGVPNNEDAAKNFWFNKGSGTHREADRRTEKAADQLDLLMEQQYDVDTEGEIDAFDFYVAIKDFSR